MRINNLVSADHIRTENIGAQGSGATTRHPNSEERQW